MRTAAALIIGNELLSGKIADENLVVLAGTLRALGVKLTRVVMVLDELDVIADEVRALAAAYDWVFTSGGVGPTHDDLTIEGVARAFGVPVVSAPNIERMLREYYGERLTEGHLLMARVPEGARLVTDGSAAWPAVVMRNVWMLPGVPQIFRAKQALIQAELSGGTPFVSHAVFTTLDEGQLKPMLDRVVAAHRDVDIGSYPRWAGVEYRTKLTFDGLVEAKVRAARDAFAESLPPDTIVRVE
ncbi:competence/damage-inducible protein A [Sorangium sp. So ce131]|uniref:competence/damage-inducible protein A n=1 Tax=Sorangium sp. So ce131 TaxID=3133282 RepID=UPI003F5D5D25